MKSAQLRIALPAAALVGFAVTPALAQRPPSPEQRIAILEQQVAASQATAIRLEQRLNNIEAQLQQLINQGEVNGHRASEIESQLTTLRNDVNGRLTALEARPVAPPPSAESVESDSAPAETVSKPVRTASASTPEKPASSADTSEAAAADPGEDAYSQAFHLWRDGKYDEAISALRKFVSDYPDHPRVSFARNLIGRALLDKGEPRPAAEALLANYRADPKGARAPDSLYYLGQALMALHQPGQACKAYSELQDVYGSSVRPDLQALVGRFSADLDRLAPAGTRIGIAVSGGPDSLALLLLAAAARPGDIEAATVDHKLRAESASEAAMVASLCEDLGVPHATLTVQWKRKPETAIQERARIERYRLLGRWAVERGLAAVATAHHADDQAETLLMRLNRGVGVRGLAGMRPVAPLPMVAKPMRLIRPLLGWRRAELVEICNDANVAPASDPSNSDEQFERVRIRRGLADASWLDPAAIARAAANLASADTALHWATDVEWKRQVKRSRDGVAYVPSGPFEIRRRIVRRAVAELANEGQANVLRGRELDRLVAALSRGGKATLRGVLCSGGKQWRFSRAPRRRALH